MDSLQAYHLVFIIAARFVLTTTLAAFFWNRKYLSAAVLALGVFLVMKAVVEVLTVIIARIGQGNMLLLHIYTPLECITLAWFYKVVFAQWKSFQRAFRWCLPIGVLIIVFNSLWVEPVSGFNTAAQTLVKLLLIVFALIYFSRNFGATDFTRPESFSLAMINSGVLIYSAGSLFVLSISRLLIDEPHQMQIAILLLSSLLFLIFQLFISAGIWNEIKNKWKP